MGLALSDQDESQIRRNHSNPSGKLIQFERVLPLLEFDLTKDEWVYQEDTSGNNGALERSDLQQLSDKLSLHSTTLSRTVQNLKSHHSRAKTITRTIDASHPKN